MKELLRHIEKYGPGWTVMFRIGEDNSIAIGLSFFDVSANKLYREEFLFTTKMINSMRGGDPLLLDTLDRLRIRVLKQRN